MRLRLSALRETANDRPPGYYEEVISRGVVEGEWLEISSENLAALRAIYRPASKPEAALPSITTVALNAARAARAEVRARLNGTPPVEPAEIERRLAICKAPCEKWRSSDNRCSECGCFGNFKTRLRSQKCPLGKW